MNNKLIAIGEALIDFIPEESGVSISEVSKFIPKVGGAPANVCGAFAKLGGRASLITQLGDDPFGDKIVNELNRYNIGLEYMFRTKKANTSLAFVALKDDGNREFSFYRKPGADMLLDESLVKEEWFNDGYALHFCSVSLIESPMKYAHIKAVDYALKNNMLVSFDPNLRQAIWDDDEGLLKAVKEFMPKAHIIKISDEEIEFITGKTNIADALEDLFVGNVELVIYTKGKDGAEVYTKKAAAIVPGETVKVVDTTGAGDAFIGSFLYELCKREISRDRLKEISESELKEILTFSNKYCAKSIMKKGAIDSYPAAEEID